MNTQNFVLSNKRSINRVFHSLIFIFEALMLLSIIIFTAFILKGFLAIGHLPFYGDKEIISHNGFESKIVIIMLYPMWFGTYLWIATFIFGLFINIKRERKAFICGLAVCVVNLLISFSSQLAWILD